MDVRNGQHFEVCARAVFVQPRVMRSYGITNGMNIVVLSVFRVNGGDHIARGRIHHLPEIFIAERQIHPLPVGRDLHAVCVRAEVLAPIDLIRFQIKADQVVFLVGSDIQLSELNAGCDTFVIAAIGHINLFQQPMTVIDIVNTDAAFVRDVKPPLPVGRFAVSSPQIAPRGTMPRNTSRNGSEMTQGATQR